METCYSLFAYLELLFPLFYIFFLLFMVEIPSPPPEFPSRNYFLTNKSFSA